MNRTQEEILKECPEWFHSIQLSPTVITPGRKSAEGLLRELRSLRLPDLQGKSVLDIGAYDGYFSFAVENLGARRVVALDHYVWSVDMAAYTRDWNESKRTGVPLPPPHESAHWHPESLPGRKPFDLARDTLESRVEPMVGDFMSSDLSKLGQYDVTLFLGVLYHLEDPLEAVRRLYEVTAPGGLAVIETEAMEIPGVGSRPCCEFFPGGELNNDPSNWWAPNARAIKGLCTAAGFREVTVFKNRSLSLKHGIPRRWARSLISFTKDCLKGRVGLPILRYRAVVHARR